MKKLKKQLVSGVLFLFCFLISYSFTISRLEPKMVDLSAAIQAGTISAEISNNGGYSTESILLNLKNNSSTALQIKIPAGTIFKPSDEGDQDLILPQDEILVLNPKSQLLKTLDAYCMQASDRSPDKGGKVKISKNANEKMTQLLTYFRDNKVNKSDVQDALWAVSDGHSICNISNENSEGKNLRIFLSGLTGQENTWYSTPQARTVQADRSIQQETVTVQGLISYTVPKGTIVYNEICSADGTSIHKTEGRAAPFGGKTEFTFTIRVKGWKKGQYFVKVKESNKEIKSYPFEIV